MQYLLLRQRRILSSAGSENFLGREETMPSFFKFVDEKRSVFSFS